MLAKRSGVEPSPRDSAANPPSQTRRNHLQPLSFLICASTKRPSGLHDLRMDRAESNDRRRTALTRLRRQRCHSL
jgi:hypothetical protein